MTSSGPPSFMITWGCQMIAYMLDAAVYGAGLTLVLQYFHTQSGRDGTLTKATVGLLFVFATLQIIFLSHQVFIDFIIRLPTNPALLDYDTFSATAQLLAVYLTAFTAQMFFASRIWILAPNKKKLLYTVPVITLASMQIIFGITQTILSIRLARLSLLGSTTAITSTQAACTAACDLTITAILCWLLNTSRSGIRRTDNVVDKLIIYAIERGAATSLCAVLNLATFVGVPHTFVFMIFLLPSCHLYVISVTTMLGSRSTLRKELTTVSVVDSFPLGSMVPSRDGRSEGGVHVQRSVLTWNDADVKDVKDGSVHNDKIQAV